MAGNTYEPHDDYTAFSADQLQDAARRIGSELATQGTIGRLNEDAVQQQQDLRTYLLREAGRRNGS